MVGNRCGYRFFSVSQIIMTAVLALVAAGAAAQTPWKPQRPVELIVGSAAGNSNDLMLRLIAQVTQEKRLLDVPMNVMNKPGGGNTIAWSYLNQHANDGHYLMMANLNLSVGHLTGTTTFSYRDFTPVCLLYDEYVVFVVRNESPIKTGRDLLERLKKDPASLSVSFSSVAGGANHIAAGLVFKAAGVDIKKVRAVVFDSAGKAITAALGGHVDFVSASASSAVSHLKAGDRNYIAEAYRRSLCRGADLPRAGCQYLVLELPRPDHRQGHSGEPAGLLGAVFRQPRQGFELARPPRQKRVGAELHQQP